MAEFSNYFGLILGIFLGFVIFWLLRRSQIETTKAQLIGESQVELATLNARLESAQTDKTKLELDLENTTLQMNSLNTNIADMRQKLGAAESTATNTSEQVNTLQHEKNALAVVRDELIKKQQSLSIEVTELTTNLEAERKQAEEKLAILINAKEELSNQFKTLATEILEEKSKRFTEQNQTNLTQLLEPLRTRLLEFQGKVEEVYINEGKERTALGEQVRNLMTLNQQLSQDAHNLTSALKGQSKTRGSWGEMILERVLEASGLRKDYEYHMQGSHTRDDNSRAQPDVVIHLPESRHLVVDAKVSLNAYETYSNSETDAERDIAIKRHIASVRSHIKELSEKNYQTIYDIQTLDFVLMFIPIEPAFMIAISHDSDLWQEAYKKNVLLVSPTTLLFVVRTVANLWRQEQQNQNAKEIASRGAELYDKLVGFVEDLDKLGDRLNQAKDSYDKAYGKFTSGRGNVIRQAEMLKELGIKPTKQLSKNLIDAVIDEPLPLQTHETPQTLLGTL